jgi:hypothetical protein
MLRRILHPAFLLVFIALLAACGPASPVAAPLTPTRLATHTPTHLHTQTPTLASSPLPALAAPAVVKRQPSTTLLFERRPAITLTFDRQMNPKSVADALTVEPPIPLTLSWEGASLRLQPQAPLTPGARYTFTLARTAADDKGLRLGQDYQWEYALRDVLSGFSAPKENKAGTPLVVTFNYSMDMQKTDAALNFQPPITGTLKWNPYGTALIFTPGLAYTASTTYTVTFAGEFVDANGDALPAPAPITFTTAPPVLAASPRDFHVHPATAIRVTFDRPMAHASTEAAFRLTPDVAGRFEWGEATLVFRPEQGFFDENTTYTVVVGAAALGADGAPVMASDYVWTFRTGVAEPIATFGQGPNAQVLDADGRRAIQFLVYDRDAPFVTFELYRLTLEQFLDRYSSNFRGVVGYEEKPLSTRGLPLAASWQVDVASAAPEGDGDKLLETLLPADAPPGAYLLDLSASRVNDQLIVLLTRNTVMVKQAGGQLTAWVTDINGEGVANAEVGVYARDGQLLAQGVADANGIFRTTVRRNPQPLIVIARSGDDLTASGLSNEWVSPNGSWNWWWWGPTPAQPAPRHSVYIYTDRPIYRPGHTVHFKAIVRHDDDAILSVPPVDTTVAVRLRDARDNVVRTIYLQTGEFGAVSSLFRLAEGAMLGSYAIEIAVDGETFRQAFKVQDYRKPDYAVAVSASAPAYVVNDSIRVAVDARYFFGEPVPSARVTVKRYQLGPNYCWEGCDDEYLWYDDGWPTLSGQTDSNGQFSLALPAELGNYSRGWYDGSDLQQSTWGIEVTVDDGSHQTVSSFTVVKVYSAAELIRLDTGGYFKTPGQPFDVRASAQTISGEPVGGRSLQLQLRRWNAGAGDYTTVVQSVDVTTDERGVAVAPLTVAQPGFYQLRLTGRDARWNDLTFNGWLYVFSDAVFWEAAPGNDLKIAAERETYAPGETAALLIESTFSGPALLTFERGVTRREHLIHLTAPLTRIEVPLQPDDAPNIFVAVNAWKPETTTLADAPRPEWGAVASLADSRLRTASVNLKVPAVDKALTITLVPDKTTYAPREAAAFTVRVTNARGEPVSAEVSLALVDEAIFSLSDELSGPIFDAFYHERGNSVRTFDSLALTRYLWMGCECGGGGGGGPSLGNPRSDFPDTAEWLPAVRTDANGEAVIAITVPDNLTRWRLTAKAVTLNSEVGEAFISVTTKQEVVVRPLLPRTLTAGDAVELSAIVHNYSGERRDLVVGIDVGAMGAVGAIRESPLRIAGAFTQTISLDPGEQRVVGWTARAITAGEAAVTVFADPLPGPPPSETAPTGEGTGEGDAVRLSLPIQPLAVQDVQTKVGQFTGEFSTVILMPGDALDMSTVRIELSRSIAGSLLNGLEYLTGYPYGCVEQTMSKALPNAVVGRAFHQLGVGNPTLQADLLPKIDASVQRLYGFQHNDGGWGWWYDDATDAYQTAWVVFGLSVTREAGYEVDPNVIQRGVDWLAQNSASMDARTRAFALYSMAMAGRGDLPATRRLARGADKLDTFSQAALALALHELGAQDDARALLDVLAQTAVARDGMVYWPNGDEDGHYQQKTMSSTTRSTALALQAFVRIDPDHELEPGIVRWLMSQRRREGWGSTNETSFTLLALTDHLLAKESATASTEYSVELNGAVIAGGKLGRGEPAVALEIPASGFQRGLNSLQLQQSGAGQLYYVISTRAYLPQAAIEAAGNVRVSRAYLDPKTSKPLAGPVMPGQLVKVQLSVVLPDDAFYVLVEDKLPGGLEALNEGLNTTSHDGSANYYEYDGYYRWQEYGYNHKEVYGDRVSFFVTEMSAGRRTFTYYARATRAGTFVALPAEVSAMYDLTVWGRSASSELVVEEER